MSDEVSADGVHITHCCARHGCKYGQGLTGQCPVVGGRADQMYVCEWDAVGPDELTAGGADEALQRAVEAAIDAWEQWREE